MLRTCYGASRLLRHDAKRRQRKALHERAASGRAPDNPAMPQTARLLMQAAHEPLRPEHRPLVRRCGLLAALLTDPRVHPVPESPDPPPLPEPLAPLPRVDRTLAARQAAGTIYTAEQQARVPRPTGGAAARAALRTDPAGALAELVAFVDRGGTLADFARRRGLAYTTAARWVASDGTRAAAYEAARGHRFQRQAEEIIRIADESTGETPAEFAHVALRIRTRMAQAERLMPGRLGRLKTEVFAQGLAQPRRRRLTDRELHALAGG